MSKRRWYNRIQEFWTDCSCGKWSASRLCLLYMNFVGSVAALWLISLGHGNPAAAVITGLVASDASVYFASTRNERRQRDCNCGGEK